MLVIAMFVLACCELLSLAPSVWWGEEARGGGDQSSLDISHGCLYLKVAGATQILFDFIKKYMYV